MGRGVGTGGVGRGSWVGVRHGIRKRLQPHTGSDLNPCRFSSSSSCHLSDSGLFRVAG